MRSLLGQRSIVHDFLSRLQVRLTFTLNCGSNNDDVTRGIKSGADRVRSAVSANRRASNLRQRVSYVRRSNRRSRAEAESTDDASEYRGNHSRSRRLLKGHRISTRRLKYGSSYGDFMGNYTVRIRGYARKSRGINSLVTSTRLFNTLRIRKSNHRAKTNDGSGRRNFLRHTRRLSKTSTAMGADRRTALRGSNRRDTNRMAYSSNLRMKRRSVRAMLTRSIHRRTRRAMKNRLRRSINSFFPDFDPYTRGIRGKNALVARLSREGSRRRKRRGSLGRVLNAGKIRQINESGTRRHVSRAKGFAYVMTPHNLRRRTYASLRRITGCRAGNGDSDYTTRRSDRHFATSLARDFRILRIYHYASRGARRRQYSRRHRGANRGHARGNREEDL